MKESVEKSKIQSFQDAKIKNRGTTNLTTISSTNKLEDQIINASFITQICCIPDYIQSSGFHMCTITYIQSPGCHMCTIIWVTISIINVSYNALFKSCF